MEYRSCKLGLAAFNSCYSQNFSNMAEGLSLATVPDNLQATKPLLKNALVNLDPPDMCAVSSVLSFHQLAATALPYEDL